MTTKREAVIQAEILLACGASPGVRIFRNTVGEGWQGVAIERGADFVALRNPRRVTFGLAPGSPDIIGWQSVLITPDMVGRTFARFVGIEVKTLAGTPADNQARFISVMRQAGALAGVSRSAESARKLLFQQGA
jgi:hypothetical protein